MDESPISTNAPTPLTYEETPIIEPVVPTSSPSPESPPKPPLSNGMPGSWNSLVLIGIVTLLFIVGVWLSSFIRQLLPNPQSRVLSPQQTQRSPTPPTTVAPDPYANWKTYVVISGVSRKAVDGVSFKLPPEISELFCDGVGCSSQGAYLPGGTRFTVAARGGGQVLADYRGKIVTDFGGRSFLTNPTVVVGRPALGFTGDFAGSTVNGYTFTKMRGVMIAVTDTLALEVNHFAPSGVSADFASDDALFTKILNSFVFTGLPTPSVGPTISPTKIPAATSSGS